MNVYVNYKEYYTVKIFNAEHIPAAQKVLQRIALIAAVFIFVISAFFILNYIQLKANPPLKSPALEKLYVQLDADPNNAELREQIRALDLLARKAYFTRQWQVNFGGYMLLAALVILLLAIKSISSMTIKYPELPKTTGTSWEVRLMTQKWVGLAGIILLVSVSALALLTRREMKTAAFAQPPAPPAAVVDFKIPEAADIESNWPCFRGPWGLGIAHYDNVPQRWDGASGENIIWKSPIPAPGFNSPIYWNGKIFTSGADATIRKVYCYDAQTGNLLWQRDVTSIPGSPTESIKVADDTGYAAPTMTTDGNFVFAIFANGDLVCFDFNGNTVWANNLGAPDNHYGHSSSLIIHRDLLLIQYDHSAQAGLLLALRANTGEQVWEAPREMGLSWSSPILVNTGSRWEVILSANPNVISYNPETGEELWRVECLGGEVGSSPVYADGFVYAANDGAKLAAIKLGATPEIVWEFNDDLPDAASLLATKDYVFVPTSYGAMSCLDAKSGEKYWLHDFDSGFYASPVLVGDNVYIMDMDGVMQIFKADKEFTLVSSASLGEAATTIPVVMDNRLYIRGSENLYCIGEK